LRSIAVLALALARDYFTRALKLDPGFQRAADALRDLNSAHP